MTEEEKIEEGRKLIELERRVRAMRDAIYGPLKWGEASWNNFKANWMQPDSVKWLEDQCAMIGFKL